MRFNRRTFIISGVCGVALASTLHMPAFAEETLSPEEKAMIHVLLSVTSNKNIRAIGGGRYNYADPTESPYEHFNSDIQSWIEMGGSRSDTSTRKSRAKAYVADIADGIESAKKMWPDLTPDQIATRGNNDLPAAWDRALKSEKSKAIFGMIDGTIEIDKKSIKSVSKAIRKAL